MQIYEQKHTCIHIVVTANDALYIRLYVCIYVCMYVYCGDSKRCFVYMYVCMYIRMYVCVLW